MLSKTLYKKAVVSYKAFSGMKKIVDQVHRPNFPQPCYKFIHVFVTLSLMCNLTNLSKHNNTKIIYI